MKDYEKIVMITEQATILEVLVMEDPSLLYRCPRNRQGL